MSKSKGKRSTSNGGATNGELKKARSDKCFSFDMNPKLEDAELKQKMLKFWKLGGSEEDWESEDITLIKSPFNCCILKNLVVSDPSALDELRSELEEQDFVEKNNDLYKFHQVWSFSIFLLWPLYIFAWYH